MPHAPRAFLAPRLTYPLALFPSQVMAAAGAASEPPAPDEVSAGGLDGRAVGQEIEIDYFADVG